ncbi:hypothetical protein [Henriciella marina]|uniref:hypothetical protein n=1 Tax=Henriciella marina TaxID=453851 RepID=UPI00036717CD|nr:hypothetical protein [Henriciella marina]
MAGCFFPGAPARRFKAELYILMTDLLNWFASLTCIAAALLVSINAGRKVSGFGFVVFSVSSAAWVAAATIEGESPLAIQNIVLLGINLFGVYRYLWAPLRGKQEVQPGE